MNLRSVLGATVACMLTATAFGQAELKVGDTAPGLDIEQWVKGEETAIETGNVYVVEFWATWCGPCKKSIPHLTELQEQYGDQGLTIIGVSTEEPELVNKFVRSQGGKMDYTVAVDRREGTQRAWMSAAGKSGIPCAFIVDRSGKIAFIGNPLPQAGDGFDETLAKVITGRYDPKLQSQAGPLIQAARNARKIRNWRVASKHFDDVMDMGSNIFASVGLEKFEMLLVDMNDREQAYEYARNGLMGKAFAADAGGLQMLAEKIATDPKIEQSNRDMDLALEAAEASRRLAGDGDATALAVLAKIRFHRGEIDQAVELQKQAYFNAAPRRKAEYKRVLTQYQGAGERASMNMKKSS